MMSYADLKRKQESVKKAEISPSSIITPTTLSIEEVAVTAKSSETSKTLVTGAPEDLEKINVIKQVVWKHNFDVIDAEMSLIEIGDLFAKLSKIKQFIYDTQKFRIFSPKANAEATRNSELLSEIKLKLIECGQEYVSTFGYIPQHMEQLYMSHLKDDLKASLSGAAADTMEI